MATVGGGYKINQKVLVDSTVTRTTAGTTTGTFYTAPANCFAIITIAVCSSSSAGTLSGTGTSTISTDGVVIVSATHPAGGGSTDRYFGAQPVSIASGILAPVNIIYVGPGQSITYSMTNNYAGGINQFVALRAFGVEYINS